MTLQYFSVYFGILFFNEYISIMYSEESINKLKIFFRIVFALLSLNVLFLSPYYFTKTQNILEFFLFLFILYICYLLYKAIKNKKENSKKMFMAFFVFGSLVLNDILYNNNIVNTDLYGPYGFVIFIFAQSFFVSRRFSQAFKETKDLSESLKKSNEELKNAKEEMTKAYKELEESQKKLFQSDKMITLGAMLAGVAHEINTPLSAIKANAENISEALKNLINKLDIEKNPLTMEDLNVAIKILNLCKTENSVFSSKEIRMAKKKVISLLEKRNHNNIDLLAEMIVELGLTEIFEKDEIILNSNNLEKHLSLVSDIYGIRKKSKVIQTSTDRVSKIVKSLKSFSHFEEDEQKQLVNISENIENVLVILNNKIKMGIEVIKNYQEDLPLILCYQDELTQIWTNLIHNAIQAMNEKGKLEIEIEMIEKLENKFDIDKRNFDYQGKYIKISIQDSGSGISDEIKPKIFEAFFTTKPAGEGSGLGLHIIGKILEKHKGMLSLESEPGKTKFSVFLPAEY
jgi:signal transduction histidine kinase